MDEEVVEVCDRRLNQTMNECFHQTECDDYRAEEAEVEVGMIDLEVVVVVQVEVVAEDNENVDYNYCSYDDDFDIEMRLLLDVDTTTIEMMTTRRDCEAASVDDSTTKRSELAL